MKAVEFEYQTMVLSPPAGTPRGECGGLPVIMFSDPPSISSFWRPSAEDLEKLNAGAHVRLDVHGTSHPPVWVSVDRVKELP